jgi:large subunit ribosomal protein L18
MNRIESKNKRHARRKRRVRKDIFGMPDRLRLSVFRSSNHIYAQIIDDTTAKTLVSASTVDKEVKAKMTDSLTKSDESRIVGTVLAQRAKAANVSKVAFDRGGFLYHGRIKALADAAREAGLDF